MKENDISEIRYAVRWISPLTGQTAREWEYVIAPSGETVCREYAGQEGGPVSETVYRNASPADWQRLCCRLNGCIETATGITLYLDGSSASLTLTRASGKTETLDRGFGNGTETAGGIMEAFLSRFAAD